MDKNIIIYKIIKHRKKEKKLNYFDYEMIFGYDFLTYNKNLEDAITKYINNNEYMDKYLKIISNKKDFNYTKPFKGINKSICNSMSYRLNKIENYVIEKEKELLYRLKKYKIDSFLKEKIELLGFTKEINKELNKNGIYTIKDLDYIIDKSNIDNNIKKIVYSKYLVLKQIVYNNKIENIEYLPISSILNENYINYTKLRSNNIYILKDMENITYEQLKKTIKLNKNEMYKRIKILHNNNIYLKEENTIYNKTNIKNIYIEEIIDKIYYYLRKSFRDNDLIKLKDLENIGVLNIEHLNKLMLKEYKDLYLIDIIIRTYYQPNIKNKIYTKNNKHLLF